MIKFRYIDKETSYILDIPEMRKFRASERDYRLKKDKLKLNDFYTNLNDYFKWFLGYCDSIFKAKTFNVEQISNHIFRTNLKTKHQYKEYLHKGLFVAKLYVEHLM